jgi:hypothetical protein
MQQMVEAHIYATVCSTDQHSLVTPGTMPASLVKFFTLSPAGRAGSISHGLATRHDALMATAKPPFAKVSARSKQREKHEAIEASDSLETALLGAGHGGADGAGSMPGRVQQQVGSYSAQRHIFRQQRDDRQYQRLSALGAVLKQV